jgi:hypothetical protein
MLKRLFIPVFALVGFMLAGSASPGAGTRPDDVLFLRTQEGITLVHAVPNGAAVSLPDAVPSTDWSAAVRAIRQDGRTEIVALDSASGARLWTREAEGNLEVKIAAEHGRLVALGSPRGSPGYPVGRSSTTLVIAGEDLRETRTIELAGNYEPEAFSTDGQSLFVVEYLPPKRPTSYRVRRLDLRTEQVEGVFTVDAELQESMQGTARVQAFSPDGKRLYTLYTIDGGAGKRQAFVHVLSLDELWAHCVDLPDAFGTADESAIALAVAPDGRHLYVAEGSTGTLAEVDTQTLSLARTGQAAFGSHGGTAHAVAGPQGTLYLTKGTGLSAVNAATLVPGHSWDVQERITGIQASTDGTRLYVGLKDLILILDSATGERLGSLDPADLKIDQLGQSTRTLEEERTRISCAC